MNAPGIIPAGRRLRILRRPPESILPSTPRPARRDCHGRLISALLTMAGEGAAIADSGIAPWHSATFVGSRHVIRLTLSGRDSALRLGTLAESLPEAEFRIPGHIVADLTAAPHEAGGLCVEVLTIEAW